MKPHVTGVAAIALTIAAECARAGLPLAFERNAGQADSGVEYVARGPGYGILFATDGATLVTDSGTVRMSWRAANRRPYIHGRGAATGSVNYLSGPREEWRTGIPLYGGVQYDDLYPGIDLVFYGSEGRLEYDFILRPGADPASIAICFGGIEDLRLDGGDLVLRTAGGELRHRRPRIYQEGPGGKEEVAGEYVLLGPREAGFQVPAYDRGRALVIDPVLNYTAYLDGAGDDRAWALAVDSSGCAYVAGETWSSSYVGTGKVGSAARGQDAFVIKLNPAGTGIVYASYFGGRGRDAARAIALDGAGNAYVAGFTYSADFPTTTGAYRSASTGLGDAFMLKLNASGSSLLYSTLFGGPGDDFATGIAVDGTGNAYMCGYTSSLFFPTTSGALQRSFGGGWQDAFVAKLNASGSGLVYSTYLGGQANDMANGIAVDSLGFAYIAGYTDSLNFPVKNAFRSVQAGQGDGFVAKLNPNGDGLVYATYLGGSQMDNALGVAVDASGNTYVAGSTFSLNFPVTSGVFQTVNCGGFDAFVSKLNAQGNGLVYSTYLGGESSEEATAIAVDSKGVAYVAGYTDSLRFPVVEPVESSAKGARDTFAAAVSPNGATLSWSTYLGGTREERATAIAVDSTANIYIAGYTFSPDFGLTPGAYRTPNATGAAFVVKLGRPPRPPSVVGVTPPAGSGANAILTFQYSDPDGAADIVEARVRLGSALANGCYLIYHLPSNGIYLSNDTATAWAGPLVPGGAGSLQNNQCTISGNGTSVSSSGSILTLTLSMTFPAAFAGVQPVYMMTYDSAGLVSGNWEDRGAWTVPGDTRSPTVVSVSPNSGSGMTGTFSFQYSDPDGASDIVVAQAGFGTAFVKGCFLFYHQPTNGIYLLNDTNTSWAGPLMPGGAGFLENSQCSISGSGSAVSPVGNTLTITAALVFRSGLAGTQPILMFTYDRVGLTSGDWQSQGIWTIPGTSHNPSTISVTPASGTGLTSTFSFQYSDPDGAADLVWNSVLIGSSLLNSCYLIYHYPSNGIYLANDANTGWMGPLVPGSAASIQNSQCTISGSTASVSSSGDVITVTLPITFRPSFAGAQPILMFTYDRTGLTSGSWQSRGTWTIP